MVDFCGFHVGKYTRPMDPMKKKNSPEESSRISSLSLFLFFLRLCLERESLHFLDTHEESMYEYGVKIPTFTP